MKGFILVSDIMEKIMNSGNVPKNLNFALDFFDKHNIDVEFIDYKKVQVTVDNEDSNTVMVDNELKEVPDFVFHVSIFNRDDYYLKAVKRMFENKNCTFINSIETAEKVEDKLYSLQLAKHFVPEVKIPKTMLINEDTAPEDVENYLSYPCVVKIMNGLQGKGVSLVNNEKELKTLLNMLFASENNNQYIAQEAIMSSKGRDLRVALAKGELLYSFVRINDKDFRSNTHANGRIEDYEPSEELLSLCRKLADVFDLVYGSIDFLFGEEDNEFYLCELNTFPGSSKILEAFENDDKEFLDNLDSIAYKLIQ